MITIDLKNKKTFKIILKHLNILYIEDETNIRQNITKSLDIVCLSVYSVGNIHDAMLILNEHRIDIIISDINLPGVSGIEFIKNLRERNIYIPVIFLSAYTEKDYLLEATKLKLVDYLVKPIDFSTLNKALVKACEEIIRNGNYIVDFENNISYNIMNKKLYHRKNNKEIDLTAKEIELLEYLISNHIRVVPHDEIKENIWNDSFDVTDSALKNLLTKLRKKIGKDCIKNISGVGFKVNIH